MSGGVAGRRRPPLFLLQVCLRVDCLASTSGAAWTDAVAPAVAAAVARGPAGVRVAGVVVSASGARLAPRSETAAVDAAAPSLAWGEALTWPLAVADLPPDAAVELRVELVAARVGGGGGDGDGAPPTPPSSLDPCPDALAGTLIATVVQPLFTARGALKAGRREVSLAATGDRAPPPRPPPSPSSRSLAARARRLARGDLGANDWLDPLAAAAAAAAADGAAAARAPPLAPPALTLSLCLPTYPAPVLFRLPPAPLGAGAGGATAATAFSPLPSSSSPAFLRPLIDPEAGLDSPAELQAASLARAAGGGDDDDARGAPLAAGERAAVDALLRAPPGGGISAADRALLWRLRGVLAADERALPLVLRAVASAGRGGPAAVEAIVASLPPPTATSLGGALALLGPELARLPAARARAAAAVAAAPVTALVTYAFFLVQALRFEPRGESGVGAGPSAVADALVARATAAPRLALALHWHLIAEWDDPEFGGRAVGLHASLAAALSAAAAGGGPSARAAALAKAAIKAQGDFVARVREMGAAAAAGGRRAELRTGALRSALAPPPAGGPPPLLPVVGAKPRASGAGGGDEAAGAAAPGPPLPAPGLAVPSPVDPSLSLIAVAPARCLVFRSALAPLMLSFDAVPSGLDEAEEEGRAESGRSGGARASAGPPSPPRPPPPPSHRVRHDLIYKKGDDLRQDALVLALIAVSDAALRADGLDLRLTPYAVLPTGPDDGLIQRVAGMPLADILREHGSVLAYLAAHNPVAASPVTGLKNPVPPSRVDSRALDALTRSLAGYAALCYVLGVGDRSEKRGEGGEQSGRRACTQKTPPRYPKPPSLPFTGTPTTCSSRPTVARSTSISGSSSAATRARGPPPCACPASWSTR